MSRSIQKPIVAKLSQSTPVVGLICDFANNTEWFSIRPSNDWSASSSSVCEPGSADVGEWRRRHSIAHRRLCLQIYVVTATVAVRANSPTLLVLHESSITGINGATTPAHPHCPPNPAQRSLTEPSECSAEQLHHILRTYANPAVTTGSVTWAPKSTCATELLLGAAVPALPTQSSLISTLALGPHLAPAPRRHATIDTDRILTVRHSHNPIQRR